MFFFLGTLNVKKKCVSFWLVINLANFHLAPLLIRGSNQFPLAASLALGTSIGNV